MRAVTDSLMQVPKAAWMLSETPCAASNEVTRPHLGASTSPGVVVSLCAEVTADGCSSEEHASQVCHQPPSCCAPGAIAHLDDFIRL